MSRELGIVGQEVFDLLVAGKGAEEVNECFHRYLPRCFGNPSDSFEEREHGIGKVVDIHASTGALEQVNIPLMTRIPEWANRFSLRIWLRIRYKPEKESAARMMPSVEVSLMAEKVGDALLHEDIISAKYTDIDDALAVVDGFLD